MAEVTDEDSVTVAAMDLLDFSTCLHIFHFLEPHEVAAAASTCRLFYELSRQDALWRHFYRRLSQPVQQLLPCASQVSDWRASVLRGLALQRLRFGAWSEVHPEPSNVRPCRREGHAAASWGKDSMILFGGWGSGIRNDLYVLDVVNDGASAPPPTPASAALAAGANPQPLTEAPRSGARPNTQAVPAAAAAGQAPGAMRSCGTAPQCRYRWRVPVVTGRRPAVRYGHSVTRCGASGELLVVYGGMQAGGYTAEIDDLAVLRPAAVAAAKDATAPAEYEWFYPELRGPSPVARGYHSACASEDGMKLYVFGGLCDRDSTDALVAIDLATWTVEVPATTGTGPAPRFGCSLIAYRDKLWVLGGGNGHDLARSGEDLYDIFCLDLATLEWQRPTTANSPHDCRVLGRCHASARVGSKLVLFGGSLDLGNDVTFLDLDTLTWSKPEAYLGRPPGKRMSAVMAVSGDRLLVFGGWIYSAGEMGDLYEYQLILGPDQQQQAKAVAAAAARNPSGVAGSSTAGAVPDRSLADVQEALNFRIARYYALLRQAQHDEESNGGVSAALERQMHEAMVTIRSLRALVEVHEQILGGGEFDGDGDLGEDEDGAEQDAQDGDWDPEETGEEETAEEEDTEEGEEELDGGSPGPNAGWP